MRLGGRPPCVQKSRGAKQSKAAADGVCQWDALKKFDALHRCACVVSFAIGACSSHRFVYNWYDMQIGSQKFALKQSMQLLQTSEAPQQTESETLSLRVV